MKKTLLFFVCLFCCIAGKAQFSVGIDGRWTLGGDNSFLPIGCVGSLQKNSGFDGVVNYSHDVFKYFFVTPSVGIFRKKYDYQVLVDGGLSRKFCSQTGVDFTLVIGKKFNLPKGFLSIFTGPRYAYAFSHSKISNFPAEFINPNSFDWRIGLGYTIWRINVNAKVDFGCLKVLNNKTDRPYEIEVWKNKRQLPTFAVGLAFII